jgi:hypothetical protein
MNYISCIVSAFNLLFFVGALIVQMVETSRSRG